MIPLESVQAINVVGRTVSLSEVLIHLHQQGHLQSMLRETAIRKVLETTADEFGVRPDSGQLQVAADNFRRTNGLFTAKKMYEWLKIRQLSVVDFERMIEDHLIRQAVFSVVVRDAVNCFETSRDQWDILTISIVDVPSEGLAAEMKAQVLEDGISFREVVKVHTPAYSGTSNMRTVKMFRGRFNRRLADTMTKGEPGELVGPVQTKDGWVLVRVDSVTCAEFSEETQAEIRRDLFNRWLNSKLLGGSISYPLLDLLSCQNDS